MIPLSYDELCSTINPLKTNRGKMACVTSLSIDSRTLKKNDLFIAIKGNSCDGHDFIDTISKHASSIILSETEIFQRLQISAPELTLFLVPDTLTAFQKIALLIRKKWSGKLVAISGSCGKTTTKDCLYELLTEQNNTIRSPGSFNNHFGVPLTLIQLKKNTKTAICEVGMNHAGEIAHLTKICQPDIGIITNVGAAHLGFFNSLEDIAAAKEELFKNLPRNAISLINNDNEWTRKMKKSAPGSIVTFGIYRKSDFMAKNITYSPAGTPIFTLEAYGKKITRILSPFPGQHNLYNLLTSIAAARVLNVSFHHICKKIPNLQLPPLRWQQQMINKRLFILDTYNANPTSVTEALRTFKQLPSEGKKICILGDMLELGDFSASEHKKIGALVAEHSFDLFIACGEYARMYSEGFTQSGGSPSAICEQKENKEIAKLLKQHSNRGDSIFVKGSRNCSLENILQGFKKI